MSEQDLKKLKSLKRHVSSHRAKRGKGHPWPQKVINGCIDLTNKGVRPQLIGNELGISPSQIHAWKKKFLANEKCSKPKSPKVEILEVSSSPFQANSAFFYLKVGKYSISIGRDS